MAVNYNQKEQQIESLRENLFAIDLCLRYDKDNYDWNGESKIGCLGIPAAILLCSLIDTIGSFFRGSEMLIPIDGKPDCRIFNSSDHFFILNQEDFYNLNLKKITITDFYQTYRSKLTHNNSLPAQNYLDMGSIDSDIFMLNLNNKIIKINLIPLFELTKKAVSKLIYYIEHGTFSNDHKLTNELKESSKAYNQNINLSCSATGFNDNQDFS